MVLRYMLFLWGFGIFLVALDLFLPVAYILLMVLCLILSHGCLQIVGLMFLSKQCFRLMSEIAGHP